MTSVSGDKELMRKINRLSVDLGKATAEATYATAQQVRTAAIKSIQKVSGGEVVTRIGQAGKPYQHTASKPGNAPNTDTGALVKSIQVQPLRPDRTMYVGTSLEYGKYLEFGTLTMEARPWLLPATEATEDDFRKNLERALDRQIQEAQR